MEKSEEKKNKNDLEMPTLLTVVNTDRHKFSGKWPLDLIYLTFHASPLQ